MRGSESAWVDRPEVPMRVLRWAGDDAGPEIEVRRYGPVPIDIAQALSIAALAGVVVAVLGWLVLVPWLNRHAAHLVRLQAATQGFKGAMQVTGAVRADLDTVGRDAGVEMKGLAADMRTMMLGLEASQRELNEQGSRLKQYLHVAESILVALDGDARITLLNRKGHEVLGYPDGELLGRDWFAVCMPPEDYEQVKSVYRQLMAGEKQSFAYYENRIITRSGDRRSIAWRNSLVLDADGRVCGTLSSGEDITDRVRAEADLRENTAKLRALYEMSPLGIALTDMSGRYVEFNEAFRKICGYSDEELKVLDYWALTPRHYEAEEARQLESLKRTGRYGPYEKEYVRKGGDLVPLQLSGTMITGQDGRSFIWSIVEDITERQLAQRKLQEQSNRFQRLADLLPGFIYQFQLFPDGRSCFPFASEAIRWIYRVEPAQVRDDASAVFAVLHPDDYARVARSIAESAERLETWDCEYRVRFPSGEVEWRHGRAMPERMPDGSTLWHGFIGDIRERKKAEAALAASEHRLNAFFGEAPAGLAMFDRELRWIYCNPSLARINGLPADELKGKRPRDVFSPEFAVETEAALSRTLTTGESFFNREASGMTAADPGVVHHWLYSQFPLHDADGGIDAVGTVVVDTTSQRRAEAALRTLNEELEQRVHERTRELQATLESLRQAQDELVRSEKMASLGALVAGVAHELNTPIGNAMLVASTLDGRQREFEAAISGGLRRSSLDAFLAGLREGSAVVERNLQRAADLIGSFKQVAVDQSSYQRREFDLAEVVQEIALAISPTLKRSGVKVLEQVPAGLRMDSYPGPLGQVLINLVNNAATHAFEEGQPGSVRIAAKATGEGRVRLIVSDDGRGIPQHNLKRIFDPFFTTRLGQGGSGLGLHITYTLVTGLLGGRIEVRSEPGHGTEFTIQLPLVAPHGGTA